jgi:hypothetical protein
MKLEEVDRASKAIMPKVTGAPVIGLTAGTTRFTVVKNTHAGVKETTNLWFISFICGLRCNLNDGTSFDFFRAEDPKLDPHDRLGFRRT